MTRDQEKKETDSLSEISVMCPRDVNRMKRDRVWSNTPPHPCGNARPGYGFAPAAQDVQEQQEKSSEIKSGRNFQEKRVEGNQVVALSCSG